jgi:hypothetical protein
VFRIDRTNDPDPRTLLLSLVTSFVAANRQPIYLDPDGNKTFNAFNADGFRNARSFVTSFPGDGIPNGNQTPVPLFVDPRGFRTDIAPSSALIVNRAVADINVYAKERSSAPDFGRIVVEVSTDGNSWTAASALSTVIRIPGAPGDVNSPGDEFVDSRFIKTYNIPDNTIGTAYRYVRIRAPSAEFELDSVGLIPGAGGPANSTFARSFLAVVDGARTNVSSVEYPAATQGPDGVFSDLRNGEFITYRAAAFDVPALIEVNRNEPQPLTRTEDDHRSSATSSPSGSADTNAVGVPQAPSAFLERPQRRRRSMRLEVSIRPPPEAWMSA